MVANRLLSAATRLKHPTTLWLRCCWCALLGLSLGAHSAEVALRDEELLITAVQVDNTVVGEDLFLYYQPGYTLVPLQQLCDIVGFSIEVDADARSASGWFFDSATTFNLDLRANQLYIAGNPVPLNEDLITAADAFDLYINAAHLAQWFNIELGLITSQLLLKVHSERPLPIARKLRRERTRRIQTLNLDDGRAEPDIENHYHGFSYPVADIQTGIVVDNEMNSRYYAIEAAGDLLWHQTNLTLNRDSAAQQDVARLSFSRRAQTNATYMPLGVSQYTFGDVFTSGDTLVNKGSGGLGFTVLRDGTDNWQSGFTEKLVEGDAPPGWEVELYRNGALVDFQVSDENGRYRFPDAPLQFGENVFDIKIYGPQGQERNRRERVHVGQGMIEPGEWRYHGSVMRENGSLFNSETTAPEKDNADFLFRYGLSKRHSVGLGWSRSSFAINREEHDYLKASLYSAWPLMSTRWDVAQDVDGGTAHNFGLSTRLFDQEYTLEHAVFKDFLSQRNPNGNIASRSKLLWSGQYVTGSGRSVPLIFNLESTRTRDGGNRLVARGLLTLSWNNFRFNSETNYFYGLGGEPRTGGGLNVHYIGNGWRFRSNTVYAVAPDAEVEQINNTIDWESGAWRYQARADVGMIDERPSRLGFNVSRRFRFGNLSLAVEGADNGDHSFRFGYDYSFGAQKTSPYVFASASRMSDKGRVRARVFVDHNGNQQFDANVDRPLAGVSFTGRREWENTCTDAAGYAELFGFNPFAVSRVGVDETSFDDPYLKAAKANLVIAHHGGGYYRVDFPVTAVSELEGHVYLRQGGEEKPASGLKLLLLDPQGKVVQETKSEFDGYYYIGDVVAGHYQLVLEDRVRQNPAFQVNTPLDIRVTADSSYIEVPAIVIEAR